MTPQQFIAKWKKANLSERSAAQQHFLDLCELLGAAKPADADPEGAHYTFERGAHKTDGGDGWADVWMRGHFGWEYKGKHKDLAAAYRQLLQYREALENPPLLVVCDLDRFEIHTNFTGTVKKVYAFNLDGLADPANLVVLRRVFTDPDSLRPGETRETITRDAADRIVDYAREFLYMRYKDPVTGKYVTRSTEVPRDGANARKAAAKVAAKWEAELEDGRYKAPSKVTWAELRQRYEDEVLPGLTPTTALKVAAMFNAVEQHVNPLRLADLTADRISLLQKALRDVEWTRDRTSKKGVAVPDAVAEKGKRKPESRSRARCTSRGCPRSTIKGHRLT